MKIATWNVNSVRARLERLLAWLQKVQPAIVCLQELKAKENDGLRLDYIFATRSLACRCTAAEIDRQERKGEKPSDHAPVVAEFNE